MRDAKERFAAWYADEAEGVLRLLTAATGDAAVAEEASAEAFARAWSRWSQVEAMDRPVAWVYRVALNLARSRFRRARLERRVEAREITLDPPEAPDAQLWLALDSLPDRERAVLVLRYVADLPQAEVAAVLGMPLGTAASTLFRARRRLAAVLGGNKLEVLP